MTTTPTLAKLVAQIAQIKTQLQALGPMRPGSLSRQYNVCGKPGCRCKDPEHPHRHGPYYQLNYVYRGKKTSSANRCCVKCGRSWRTTNASAASPNSGSG